MQVEWGATGKLRMSRCCDEGSEVVMIMCVGACARMWCVRTMSVRAYVSAYSVALNLSHFVVRIIFIV